MDTLVSMTTFFGWCSIINVGYLILSALFVMLGRNWASNMHSKCYGISKEEAIKEYFRFMTNYKILTLIFSIVPYCALKIMSN